MSGVILDCSSTLLVETVFLNQTQNSLISANFALRFLSLLSAF